MKKPTLSLVNAGPPDRVSVLSTKCGGCHPKGLIVASSYKVKQIIILIIILVLLKKNKNQLKLLFSPLAFLSSSPKLKFAYNAELFKLYKVLKYLRIDCTKTKKTD